MTKPEDNRNRITIQNILDLDHEVWGDSHDMTDILTGTILKLLCIGTIRRHTILGRNVATLIYDALGKRDEVSAEDIFFAVQGKYDHAAIQVFKGKLETYKLPEDVDPTPEFPGEVVEVNLELVRYQGKLAIAIPHSGLAEGKKLVFRKRNLDFSFTAVDSGECMVCPSSSEHMKEKRTLCHHGISQILVRHEGELGRNARGDIQWDGPRNSNPSDADWVEIYDTLMNWINYSHRPAKE